jgi:hypothetical protein
MRHTSKADDRCHRAEESRRLSTQQAWRPAPQKAKPTMVAIVPKSRDARLRVLRNSRLSRPGGPRHQQRGGTQPGTDSHPGSACATKTGRRVANRNALQTKIEGPFTPFYTLSAESPSFELERKRGQLVTRNGFGAGQYTSIVHRTERPFPIYLENRSLERLGPPMKERLATLPRTYRMKCVRGVN